MPRSVNKVHSSEQRHRGAMPTRSMFNGRAAGRRSGRMPRGRTGRGSSLSSDHARRDETWLSQGVIHPDGQQFNSFAGNLPVNLDSRHTSMSTGYGPVHHSTVLTGRVNRQRTRNPSQIERNLEYALTHDPELAANILRMALTASAPRSPARNNATSQHHSLSYRSSPAW